MIRADVDSRHSPAWRALARELRPTLALAWPVIAAELGWMAMSIVDTLMVGPLGPEAIGAVGLGHALYFAPVMFGIGLLLGMDTLVSQAFGAGRLEDCHRTLWQGLAIALAIAPPLMASVWLIAPWLAAWGIRPEVLRIAIPYAKAVAWGTVPLLLFFALRRYLQAMGRVRAIAAALLTANLLNVGANLLFIHGGPGIPAMGAVGSGWATTASRCYLFLFLFSYAILHARRARTGLLEDRPRLDRERLRELIALGLPAAVQLTLEVGVFAVVTGLAGRLAPESLAAHQIALTIASVTFMVPLGVSAAGAVRVGQAIGRGEIRAAVRAGWSALALGSIFMTLSGLAFVLVPGPILHAFTDRPDVLTIGSSLLMVAAVFQVFDGLQVVGTGILRGLGETRLPMLVNLFAHWGLALPIGYALGIAGGRGVVGLWIGLAVGLIAAGLILLRAWALRARVAPSV